MNIQTVVQRLLRPAETAYAHCDIPCGIYDPGTAQLAAESVEKMMTLMADGDASDINSQARYIAIKELNAEAVKHEVRIIWGDFMKPPDLATTPDLHDVVWEIMRLGSACRQGTNVDDAKALRAKVDEFAGIFAKVKATR
ncbi:MAG: superoxide dismutase, Ni [Dehalococcoidia bacterium]|nr:superoxide dismutase, Ni [Dehalococcoidia bacterium]